MTQLYNSHASFLTYSVQDQCSVERNRRCSKYYRILLTDLCSSKFSSLQSALYHTARPILLKSHLHVSLLFRNLQWDIGETKWLFLIISFPHNLGKKLGCLLPKPPYYWSEGWQWLHSCTKGHSSYWISFSYSCSCSSISISRWC